VLLAIAGGAIAVPSALADAEADFQAVFRDWRTDQNITTCRFTRVQLLNARNEADKTPDLELYAPGFRDEVNREIRRWDSGGCRGATPGSGAARDSSAIGGLRIKKIRPKGGARSESVVLKNTSKKTARLRGATLRDRAGNRLRLPRKARIRRGRTIRVFTGCKKGVKRRRPFKKGRRIYGCRRKQLWNDGGDVVRLVDADGVLIARRGYGRFKSVPKL
jgi:lamin tail-like protein